MWRWTRTWERKSATGSGNEFSKYNPYGDDAFKVAVLGRGYKYTPIGLNQKDSQYIESRTFSVEEVARFSGVPKSMLQSGKESFESNQQQRIVFVTDVLMPYIVQWEQENSYKCLFRQQRADGLYFKGNPAVLLRGDDKSRAEFLTTMIQNGMLNPDEARALEERAPIPGGWGQTFFITKPGLHGVRGERRADKWLIFQFAESFGMMTAPTSCAGGGSGTSRPPWTSGRRWRPPAGTR